MVAWCQEGIGGAGPEVADFRGKIKWIRWSLAGGYLGILPGHAALLGQLGTGFLSYRADGSKRYVSISGGFLEVKDDHVRVLADRAERAEEIDVERARRALERAQERIASSNIGIDPARALAAMQRAQARIETAQRK